MKTTLLIIFTFFMISCGDSGKTKSTSSLKKDTALAKISTSKNTRESKKNKNQFNLNFAINKDLLYIIILLPDTCFESWEWKLNDRKRWYNEIKLNNSYTEQTSNSLRLNYFERNKASFSIVNGLWTINTYKADDNSTVIITDDVVADGNQLCFYELKNKRLSKYEVDENPILNFKGLLKKKQSDAGCKEKFNALDDPIFEYNFSTRDKIEIESSWYLAKEKYQDCLVGNAIILNFNPKTKLFEVEKIYWKAKQNEKP